MFDVMNRQIVVARETDEVVLVTLVIAHEDVLAMHTPVVVPPPFGFLDGFAFRVIVRRERNPVFLQIPQNLLLPFRNYLVVIHISHVVDYQTIRGISSAVQVHYE